MATELRMPKVKAYENGELEIIPGHENGWRRIHPVTDCQNPPSLTTIFASDYGGYMELVVTSWGLENGDSVHMLLVAALYDAFHEKCDITSPPDDDDTVEKSLAHTVNMGFAKLAAAYNKA